MKVSTSVALLFWFVLGILVISFVISVLDVFCKELIV